MKRRHLRHSLRHTRFAVYIHIGGNPVKYLTILLLVLGAISLPVIADSPQNVDFPTDQEIAEAAANQGISVDPDAMREEFNTLSSAISSGNGASSSLAVNVLQSANTRDRFICPKTIANLYIKAWADASYDGSTKRFTQVHDKGFYYSEDSILFNFNVDGSTSAYVQNDGTLLVRFSGTINTYTFYGQWLGSSGANFSCKFVLT